MDPEAETEDCRRVLDQTKTEDRDKDRTEPRVKITTLYNFVDDFKMSQEIENLLL